jgi:hypothetical protein
MAQKFANQQRCCENQVNGASVNPWDHENHAEACDNSSRSCESAERDVADFQLSTWKGGNVPRYDAIIDRHRTTDDAKHNDYDPENDG